MKIFMSIYGVITKKSWSKKKHEVIKELFISFLKNCQEALENKMKDSDFIFDYVDGLSYLYNKISLNCGRSYINSTDWTKNRKAAINPIKKCDNKSFQYVAEAT